MRQEQREKTTAPVDHGLDAWKRPLENRSQRFHPQQQRREEEPYPQDRAREDATAPHLALLVPGPVARQAPNDLAYEPDPQHTHTRSDRRDDPLSALLRNSLFGAGSS